MNYSTFTKTIKANIVESVRSYRQLIEKTDGGKFLINGTESNFKTIEEANMFFEEFRAIYNGQYAKGLVHVMIVGLLISILDRGDAHSLEPLLGLMLAAFWAYMAFEAHHTARQRRMGMVADEFSSLLPLQGASRFPVAPVLLIALGVIFLLDNLGVLAFDRVFRYWPVLMIALGVYMLYTRLAGNSGDKQ